MLRCGFFDAYIFRVTESLPTDGIRWQCAPNYIPAIDYFMIMNDGSKITEYLSDEVVIAVR